jgi:FkbM family methyltransferase
MRWLKWLPPSVAASIYTIVLKPRPLRALAQAVIKRMIPPEMDIGDGVRLVLNPQDAVVCGALALGCYERYELEQFQAMLRPGMCVLDVGANIGLYAAVAAKRVGPGGKVFAIEPERRNCELVQATIARNGFTNVTVIQAAAGDSTGAGSLFICADNKADHRTYDSADGRQAVPVDLTTLDDLAAARGLPPVDLMKMDIQGSEARAWRGMGRMLAASPAVRIMMEFWPWGLARAGDSPAALLADIRRQGFRIYELDADRRRIVEVTDDGALASRNLERQHANLLVQRGPLEGLTAS